MQQFAGTKSNTVLKVIQTNHRPLAMVDVHAYQNVCISKEQLKIHSGNSCMRAVASTSQSWHDLNGRRTRYETIDAKAS